MAKYLVKASHLSETSNRCLSKMTNVGCVHVVMKTPDALDDPGLKINGTCYRDILLTQQLLPVTREISGEFVIF